MDQSQQQSQISKKFIEQTRLTEDWLRSRAADNLENNFEVVELTYGHAATTPYGRVKLDHHIGLLQIPMNERPDFALGIPKMVDLIVDDFREQLKSNIQSVLSVDPWNETSDGSKSSPAGASATKAGSVGDAATQAVPAGSTSGGSQQGQGEYGG